VANENEQRDPLTAAVIGAAIEVHRNLGQGLLESAYERCLEHELKLRGLRVRRQVPMPIAYKDLQLEKAYVIDLLAEERLIVELKAIDRTHDVHEAQILTYLRFSGMETGLLLNFNVPMMKLGVRRYVYTHPEQIDGVQT